MTQKLVIGQQFGGKTVQLPNNTIIFRAELFATSLAVEVICHSKEKDFIIFSDSMSSVVALSGFQLEHDLVRKIITGQAVAETCCISYGSKYRKSGNFDNPWEQNP